MTIPPITTLGHYTIISKIGAGGMGDVSHHVQAIFNWAEEVKRRVPAAR